MCTTCRAEASLTEIDDSSHSDATTFCAEHRPFPAQSGFELLVPPAQLDGAARLGDRLPAGATMTDLIGHRSRLSLHAALGDMSSLCGLAASGTLLEIRDLRWSEVPGSDRYRACITAAVNTSPPDGGATR